MCEWRPLELCSVRMEAILNSPCYTHQRHYFSTYLLRSGLGKLASSPASFLALLFLPPPWLVFMKCLWERKISGSSVSAPPSLWRIFERNLRVEQVHSVFLQQMGVIRFYPIPGSMILAPTNLCIPQFPRGYKFPPQKSSSSHRPFHFFSVLWWFLLWSVLSFHFPHTSRCENPSFLSAFNVTVTQKMYYLLKKKKKVLEAVFIITRKFLYMQEFAGSQALDSFLTDCR